MKYSSHRIKLQEKKLLKNILITIVTISGLGIFSLYIGLPLLAKTIILLSSGKVDKTTSQNTASSLLLPPVLNPIPEATNSSKLRVSGFVQSNAIVKILINNANEVKITPDTDGKFTSRMLDLKEGENFISTFAIKDSLTSEVSTPVSVVYKKDPPNLEISSPKDGEKFSEDTKDTVIVGSTDQESKITINDRFVIVNGSGKFSFPVSLSNGENVYKIVSTDRAGNQTTQELKLHYSP